MATAFIDGRLDYVASLFVCPLPVFMKDELIVFGSADTLVEGLEIYRDTALSLGITQIHGRVVAEGLPRSGCFNLWVEWDHQDDSGTCLRMSQVRYVARHMADGLFPRFEVADYTVTGFPEMSDGLVITPKR